MFKPLPFAAEQDCYNLRHGGALGDAQMDSLLPIRIRVFQRSKPFVRDSWPYSPQVLKGSPSSTPRTVRHRLGYHPVPGWCCKLL